MHTIFWSENLKERDLSEDLSVGGRIISEWTLGKQGEKVWTGCIWLRIGTSGRCCEHGDEPSGSIKRGEYVD
jgi:hypothetical protein